jgi:hypothetical protein
VVQRREFIRSIATAPLVMDSRLSAVADVVSVRSNTLGVSHGSAHAVLVQRAARFRDLILQVATGPGGMIISFPLFHPRRPLQEGEPPAPCLAEYFANFWGAMSPQPTVAEAMYGENTLWVTGLFLWSQILRYKLTHEPEALETARKCFRDLNHIFRICAKIEPGLLGKPHGGCAGPTTSYDQSAWPVLFYVQYAHELATPAEKAEAVRNMALHGEYYLARNWVMNHFGHYERVVEPGTTSTMKYLACVYAAYELTGDKRFRDAAFKYLRQIIHNGDLPWPSKTYQPGHNMLYWATLCDYWSKTEMAKEFDWHDAIRQYWEAARTATDAEGLHIFGRYEVLRHSFTPYPDRWLTRKDLATWPELLPALGPEPFKPERTWSSSTDLGNRALDCACTAALAFLVRSLGLDDQAHVLARKTLLRMDEDTLRLWWDDGKLPTEMKPMHNIFAPEVAACWQVAYWMGRSQNILM